MHLHISNIQGRSVGDFKPSRLLKSRVCFIPPQVMPYPLHFHIFHASFCKYKCSLSMKARSLVSVLWNSFELLARFCHQLKSEEIKTITGFFNLLNAPLQVALCKYVPSQGVIRLQWPYRQVRWDAKQAALASGKGRRRLYTRSWLMYIWRGGGGFIKRALSWAAGKCWGPSEVTAVPWRMSRGGAWSLRVIKW